MKLRCPPQERMHVFLCVRESTVNQYKPSSEFPFGHPNFSPLGKSRGPIPNKFTKAP